MSGTPFMQFYPGDYLGKTMDLTTEQHGAYLLILMTMWQHNAKLPNDPAKLARIARMTPAKFKAVWSEISRFFFVEGDSITSKAFPKWEAARRRMSCRDAIPMQVKMDVLAEKSCAYCGSENGPFEVDHIHPWSRGGSNDRENLTLACRSCNRSKRDMTLEEWLQ